MKLKILSAVLVVSMFFTMVDVVISSADGSTTLIQSIGTFDSYADNTALSNAWSLDYNLNQSNIPSVELDTQIRHAGKSMKFVYNSWGTQAGVVSTNFNGLAGGAKYLSFWYCYVDWNNQLVSEGKGLRVDLFQGSTKYQYAIDLLAAGTYAEIRTKYTTDISKIPADPTDPIWAANWKHVIIPLDSASFGSGFDVNKVTGFEFEVADRMNWVIWIDDIQVTTDQSVYTIGVPDNFDSYTTPDSFKAEWSIQTNKLDDPNFYTMSFPQGYNGQGKSITTWFNLGSTAWLNYYKPITIPSMANYISFWTYYNGSTDFNVDYTDPQNEKGGAGIWLSNSTTKYKYNFDLKANEGWVQRIIPLTADALGEGFDPNTITTIWLHFGKASTNITLSFDNLEFYNNGISTISNFLTRSGDKVMDGSSQFRFASVNCNNLLYNEMPAWHLNSDWELDDLFKSVQQIGGSITRMYTLPIIGGVKNGSNYFYGGPGVYNETMFQQLDKVLAYANSYGIRVIIPLIDHWSYEGGTKEFAAFRGKTQNEFYTDSALRTDFKNFVSYILNRTNVYTGVKYKNDKAIAYWELGNELQGVGDSVLDTWTLDIAQYIKGLDSNHLIMDGRDIHVMSFTTAMRDSSYIDLISAHYYYLEVLGIPYWASTINNDRNKTKNYKPFIIGEYGDTNLSYLTTANSTALSNGTTGTLIWSLQGHNERGGYYGDNTALLYHYPGAANSALERDTITMIRNYAYQFRGISAPALPVPDAPYLYRATEIDQVNYRGSTGATNYVLERAVNSNGPWTVINNNLQEDTDISTLKAFEDFNHYIDDESLKTYWKINYNTGASGVYSNSFVTGQDGTGKALQVIFNTYSSWLQYESLGIRKIPGNANYISVWTYWNESFNFNQDLSDPTKEKGGIGIWLKDVTNNITYKYKFNLNANEGWVRHIIPLDTTAFGAGFNKANIQQVILQVGKIGSGTVCFDDFDFLTQTPAAADYYYRMKAVNSSGSSAYSNIIRFQQ